MNHRGIGLHWSTGVIVSGLGAIIGWLGFRSDPFLGFVMVGLVGLPVFFAWVLVFVPRPIIIGITFMIPATMLVVSVSVYLNHTIGPSFWPVVFGLAALSEAFLAYIAADFVRKPSSLPRGRDDRPS